MPSATERLRSNREVARRDIECPAGGSAQPSPSDVTDSLRDGPSLLRPLGYSCSAEAGVRVNKLFYGDNLDVLREGITDESFELSHWTESVS